jgi:tRNA A-37 threonylcarbamoyl transferase component Bud32/DNA-binding NarL/FixJ family response regulator
LPGAKTGPASLIQMVLTGPDMGYRFFIIDDNSRFRATLKRMLLTEWPDAFVEEFDPLAQGWPGDDIDWTSYDLLFIDYDLKSDNGLEWFTVLASQGYVPPTVILSSKPDPQVAVKAIKAGAENYLPKRRLDGETLRHLMSEAAHFSRFHEVSGTTTTVAAHPPKEQQSEEHKSTDQKSGDQISGSSRVIHLMKKGIDRGGWPDIRGHRILGKIGQGGMSTIYLAQRERDNQEVVVKTLLIGLVDNKKTLQRSNQEFKLISRIKHPNIVRLYEHGTLGDVLYTTMEYFPNGDLKQRLREGITQQQALSYTRQIAEGLNAIHGCGIIHRDLKPGNIMFRQDETLAIIDFGISKDINSQLDLTIQGQVMGTPNYMAPEQGKGAYKPDARSDLYSLGVLLYEMLTGNKPFAAPTSAAVLYKHLHDPIPHLPNQFFELQILIDKLMAKFPHQRIQSAYDLLHFLDEEYPLWDAKLDFS